MDITQKSKDNITINANIFSVELILFFISEKCIQLDDRVIYFGLHFVLNSNVEAWKTISTYLTHLFPRMENFIFLILSRIAKMRIDLKISYN